MNIDFVGVVYRKPLKSKKKSKYPIQIKVTIYEQEAEEFVSIHYLLVQGIISKY